MNWIIGNFYLCIWGHINPTLRQFIFVHLVQHLQMSWTSFSKPSFGVDLAPVVKICNRKILGLDLGHPIAFLAYLEASGSCFSWWYLKKPILGFLARSGNNGSDQCILPHGVSKDISSRASAFIISIMIGPMKLRPLATNLQALNPAKP